MSKVATDLLRATLKQGHEVLEGTMADVDDATLNWQPPGIANSIGANYAHIVTGEDALINAIARKGAPLLASSWAGKIGLSEPPPVGPTFHDWARRVKIDLTALRAYAQAVYAATDEYLTSLSDADLGNPVDMPQFGNPPLGAFLNTITVANLNWHTGEIAALKGVQGKKGYPF